jgi:hypothetical protein
MKIFSRQIFIESGQPLGGYAGNRLSYLESNNLELNGISFKDFNTGRGVELCSIDALYAGDLNFYTREGVSQQIFAASHTHFAPMLDSAKPLLGAISQHALIAWREALDSTLRVPVNPTSGCSDSDI